MKLFANSAKEIEDSDNPSGYSRFKDDSKNYAKGFPYGYLFNSALLNGILHRITAKVKDLIHVKAKTLGVDVDFPYRYVSPDEIRDLNNADDTNFILNADKSVVYNARISPFLLKKDKIEDFFNNTTKTGKTYITKKEHQRFMGVIAGIDLPPYLIKNPNIVTTDTDLHLLPECIVPINRVVVFSEIGLQQNCWTRVDIKFENAAQDQLAEIEVRTAKIVKDSRYSEIMTPAIYFSQDRTFRDFQIKANTPYLIKNKFRIIWKNDKIYHLEGLVVQNTNNINLKEVLRNYGISGK